MASAKAATKIRARNRRRAKSEATRHENRVKDLAASMSKAAKHFLRRNFISLG
jgi:hypothetical protein